MTNATKMAVNLLGLLSYLVHVFSVASLCSAQILQVPTFSIKNATLSNLKSAAATTSRPTFDQIYAKARAEAIGRGIGRSLSLHSTLPDIKPRVVPETLTFDVDVNVDDSDQTHEFFLPRQTLFNHKTSINSANDEEWQLINNMNSNSVVKRFDQRKSPRGKRDWRVCDGTNNQFSTAEDEHTRYKQLQNRYENCQIVDGNLELTYLPAGYDFTFLSSIREVTGYVLISGCNVSVLSLNNLSIIRGRTVLDFGTVGGSERTNLALFVKDNLNLNILDLRSLREIVRGRVNIVDNAALCFVDTIDWNDIVSDDDDDETTANQNNKNSAVILQKNADEKYCHLRDACSERCPRIKRTAKTSSSAAASCWGRDAGQCQRRNKRNCADQCQGGRCFGPDARQCCHAYCAGGCFGPLQSDCFSCRHFDNNGTCVLECPPPQIYDPNSYQLRPNPHARYAYGSQCVEQCPRHLLRDGGACVGKCPPGKQEVEGQGRCDPCPNGECTKNCMGSDSTSSANKDSAFINANNIDRFANCTVIQGDIVILQSTFDGMAIFDEQTGEPIGKPVSPLEPSALAVFQKVHEVTGSVIIEGAHPELRSLSFLQNLRVIYGRNARKHDDETFYSLRVIASPYLERLDLRSLERIYSGGVLISRNPRLCLAESIDWSGIVAGSDDNATRAKSVEQRNIVVSDNSPVSNCSARGLTCNEQCDQRAGCWGPKSTQCKKCKRFALFDDDDDNDNDVIAGSAMDSGRRAQKIRRCITNCSMPGVYFNPQHQPLLPSLAQSTATTVQNICHRCHDQCAHNCYGPGPGNCTKCKRAQDGPFCVGQCPPTSKYLNTTSGQCEMCHPNCLDGCRGPQNTIGPNGCNSCAVAVLNADTNNAVDKCQPVGSSCPWEYYAEYVQRAMQNKKDGGVLSALVGRIVCRKCDPLCSKCSREGVECDECRYFRQRETGICVQKCGDGYWTNATDRTCHRCHPQCDGCRDGSGSEDCVRCRNVRVYAAEASSYSAEDKFNCSDKCPAAMPFKSLLNDVTDDAICTSNASLSASYYSTSSRSGSIVFIAAGTGLAITALAVVVTIVGYRSRRRNDNKSIALRAKQLALQLSPQAADDFLGEKGEAGRKGATLGKIPAKPNMGKLQIIALEELTLATHPLGLGAFGFVRQGIWKIKDKSVLADCDDEDHHGIDGSKHVRKASAASSSSSDRTADAHEACKKKPVGFNNSDEEDTVSCADSAIAVSTTTANRNSKKPKNRRHSASATLVSAKSKSTTHLKVPVAVKQLNDVTNVETNSQFLDEACMMASLKHRHIVPLLGVCLTHQPMLVTPLMLYGSIQDYMKEYGRNNSVITAPQMMSWFLQMAQGMRFLEENNVVHRDLAARNVLLQTPTFCRIADFGLAKLLGLDESEYWATPGSKLPLRWLALESIMESKFTHKSDVWAFGITLWEILMFGAKPYGDRPDLKPHQLAERLIIGERLPQPPTASVNMFTLLAKCWAAKAEVRPSFDMLVKQLEHLSRAPTSHIVIIGHAHQPLSNVNNPSGAADATDSVADKWRRSSILLYSGSNNDGSNYPPAVYTNDDAPPQQYFSAGSQKQQNRPPQSQQTASIAQYSTADYTVNPNSIQQPYRASTTGRPRSLRLASAPTFAAVPTRNHLLPSAVRPQRAGAAENTAYLGPATPSKTIDQKSQQKRNVRKVSEPVITTLAAAIDTYTLNTKPARPQRLRLPVLPAANSTQPLKSPATAAEYCNDKSPATVSGISQRGAPKATVTAEHPYDDVCIFDGHISDNVFDTASEAAGRTPTHPQYEAPPPLSAQQCGTAFVFPPTTTFSPPYNTQNRRSLHYSGNFSTFSQLSSSSLIQNHHRQLQQQQQQPPPPHQQLQQQQSISLQNSPVRKVFCEPSQLVIHPQHRRPAICAPPAASYYRGVG